MTAGPSTLNSETVASRPGARTIRPTGKASSPFKKTQQRNGFQDFPTAFKTLPFTERAPGLLIAGVLFANAPLGSRQTTSTLFEKTTENIFRPMAPRGSRPKIPLFSLIGLNLKMTCLRVACRRGSGERENPLSPRIDSAALVGVAISPARRRARHLSTHPWATRLSTHPWPHHSLSLRNCPHRSPI